MKKRELNPFFSQIMSLLHSARHAVTQTINRTMVMTYYQIGRMIVEEEQDGKERAAYGKELLKELSGLLTKEFGKGFSVTNLKQMRQFFIVYSKSQTVSDELYKHIFASKYKTVLPSKAELKSLIESI